MASPFPGIDPFLESQGLWPDFHLTFLVKFSQALMDQLPEPYSARIDGETVTRAVGTRFLESRNITVKVLEEHSERYIKILHGQNSKPVSVIEVLTPFHKAGEGRRDYLIKRNGLMQSDVDLIELDFLVSGSRLPTTLPLPTGDFHAIVSRAERRPACEIYTWTVRGRLPIIPIPVPTLDGDIEIDLGSSYTRVHDNARYARSIRYDARLRIPLAPEDRAWAEELARSSRG
jgi:hypothetical protein